MNDDILDLWAFDGSTEIKTLDDSGKFEGLAIPFGAPDFVGDRFDSSTIFGRSLKGGADLLYYHGLPMIGKESNPLAGRIIGEAEFKTTDAGIWMTGQLNLRDDYEMKVWQMVKEKKLGLSTGSAPHRTARTKNQDGSATLKTWPIVEVSLTPSPANPRTSVYAIKTLIESLSPPEAPESVGFIESLKRAESALAWADGKELNGAKRDALKSLTETVKRYRDPRVDAAKVQAAFASSEKFLSRINKG